MADENPPVTPDGVTAEGAPATIEGVGMRVEPVGLETEMQRSYLDYAMSVIVSRALPDVRDGLKPVHRRVLYAMYDGGYRPDRGYFKCARVVGEVMGVYHSHGDTAIYDTLVRLAQPWSMRAPLVDGNGNFGSPGNDPAAAMRYCVSGDTLVRTSAGTLRIDQLVPGAPPDSEAEIDLKVLDRLGNPVRATRLFHSGEHPTLRLRTVEGFELVGTRNHPILCLAAPAGVPMLLWRLLEEIGPGDRVALARQGFSTVGDATQAELDVAIRAGEELTELPSADKRVPAWVWAATPAVKRAFLQSLFTGDGSSSLLARRSIQVSYSTRSARL